MPCSFRHNPTLLSLCRVQIRYSSAIPTLGLRKCTTASLISLLKRLKTEASSSNFDKQFKQFEEKIWDSMKTFDGELHDQRVSQSLSVTDYLKPRMENVAALTHLIAQGKYPQSLIKNTPKNPNDIATDIMANLWHQHCLESEILGIPYLEQADTNWDITRPSEWFPQARKMKRKFIMHVGPTNSGKTYNALQAFSKARSGYYAGPLRLLAREIYERFLERGISCNLITGEEVVPALDLFGNVSQLSSGTIEMIPLHKKMDICIIDEIQMIADPSRGSAWTNAVLGVQAKEIHLCGEESAVLLIKELLKSTGDELVVKRYDRLGKLTTLLAAVKRLQNLKKGDCVVAFSKRMILELKCKIENATNMKVGVIYGALPPEIRSQEASRFNNEEYDLLVASDAIGMGLNLRIRRVVFWTVQKFNGMEKDFLSVSATRQIGGRAGRFSLKEGELEGFVTSFHPRDLSFIRKTMNRSIPKLEQACIWPPNQFWVQYLSSFRKPRTLESAVRSFYQSIEPSSMKNYFISESEHVNVIELMCDRKLESELAIEDQLKLSQVPINLRNAEPELIEHTFRLLQAVSKTESKTVFDLDILDLNILRDSPSKHNTSSDILAILTRLEQNHKLVLVFMWLSQRWPTIFIDKESAHEVKTIIEKRISEELNFLRKVASKPLR